MFFFLSIGYMSIGGALQRVMQWLVKSNKWGEFKACLD